MPLKSMLPIINNLPARLSENRGGRREMAIGRQALWPKVRRGDKLKM
jgi:hypothetical protein